MKLPSFKDLKVSQKKVLLRTNYDVPLTADGRVTDESRIEESLPTIDHLLARQAKVIIISHLSRPGGKVVPSLSLKPVVERLRAFKEGIKIDFSPEVLGEKTEQLLADLKPGGILVLENLRFDPGEEENDQTFARQLAGLADFYLNDAFAVSHRHHASIVGVPQFLPSAFGFDFLWEIKSLSQVLEKPQRPVVVILGGVKKSKIEAVRRLTQWADSILVGGKMIEYDGIPKMIDEHQKVIGSLTRDGEDITMETVERFKKIIAQAKTIIWSGPMGAFEEKDFERGTKEIAQAAIESGAHTVVGGGDTEAALTEFGLIDKVNYISSGGGAMLAFLADKTLVGIEAIKKKND